MDYENVKIVLEFSVEPPKVAQPEFDPNQKAMRQAEPRVKASLMWISARRGPPPEWDRRTEAMAKGAIADIEASFLPKKR